MTPQRLHAIKMNARYASCFGRMPTREEYATLAAQLGVTVYSLVWDYCRMTQVNTWRTKPNYRKTTSDYNLEVHIACWQAALENHIITIDDYTKLAIAGATGQRFEVSK